MRRLWLFAALWLVAAAAPLPSLRADANCIYQAIDLQARQALGASMATGSASGDQAEKSLARAMKGCGAAWPQERMDAAISYAGSRMMFEWAGLQLSTARVDPQLVIQWFDSLPADRRTSLFAKGGDEAADALSMSDAVAFLRAKGVSEATVGANMEPLGHALAALVIGARLKAGLPL